MGRTGCPEDTRLLRPTDLASTPAGYLVQPRHGSKLYQLFKTLVVVLQEIHMGSVKKGPMAKCFSVILKSLMSLVNRG